MSSSVAPVDVTVVGAGPTGLLLAGDIAAAGVSCRVLERRGQAEDNLSRAFAVHARTLEILDCRGFADRVLGTGNRATGLRVFSTVDIDMARLQGRTRFPFLLNTPQYNVDGALLDRAAAQGAEIVYGTQVTGLHQDGEGVDIQAQAAGAGPVTYRTRYVVGADGVHSTVREALGVPYPGKSVLTSLMLADVRLTDPPKEDLAVTTAAEGFVFVAPFGDGWFRLIGWDRRNQLPDDAPLQLADLQAITRCVFGSDLGMHGARWMSRFHSDERQAKRYRAGRAVLIGDAAHCHSPAGGLGMNTGLQDAANLSWKLVATVQGWAPPGLLDSYQSERHPVGRTALRVSGTLIRLATRKTRLARTTRDIIAATALRTGPIAGRAAGTISGIGIGYPRPRGAHPLTGTRMPDLPLSPGTDRTADRLYQLLDGTRFVLLAPGGTRAGGWQQRVDVATAAGALPTAILSALTGTSPGRPAKPALPS